MRLAPNGVAVPAWGSTPELEGGRGMGVWGAGVPRLPREGGGQDHEKLMGEKYQREQFQSLAFLPGRKENFGNFFGSFVRLLGLRLQTSP